MSSLKHLYQYSATYEQNEMSDFQLHQDGGGLRSHADLYFAILGVKNSLPSYTVPAQNSTTTVCIHINASTHTYVIDRYKTNKQTNKRLQKETNKPTKDYRKKNKETKERKKESRQEKEDKRYYYLQSKIYTHYCKYRCTCIYLILTTLVMIFVVLLCPLGSPSCFPENQV